MTYQEQKRISGSERQQNEPSKQGNIFSKALIQIYPPVDQFDSSMSPLICIGQDVSLASKSGRIIFSGIFSSPAGQIVFILADQIPGYDIPVAIERIKMLGSGFMDSIAEDYTYKVTGQALRVIDIMANHNYLTFSDGPKLSRSIDRCISDGKFVLLCADKSNHKHLY